MEREKVLQAIYNHRQRLEDMQHKTWAFRYWRIVFSDAMSDLDVLVAFAEKELDL